MGCIFVIDGNTGGLASVAQALGQEGYCIQTFAGDDDILTKAIAKLPELILCNTSISVVQTYQLCFAFKSHAVTRHIPLILIDQALDIQRRTKALELGFDDYIAEPCVNFELLMRFRIHLRTQALNRRLIEQEEFLQGEIFRRQLAEERLKLAEEKFGKAFYSSPNPSTITLLSDGRHIEVNDSFCQVTGYTTGEIIGKNAVELNLWVNLADRDRLFDLIRRDRRVKNHEFEFRTKHGTIHTAILSCEIIWINGEECLLSLSNDITDRKRVESQLQHANSALKRLADLDGLTQIANRRRFDTYLKYHLAEARKKGKYLSMFLCDVDHFKAYNDYYGHVAGDNCLVKLANIFRQTLTDSTDFVARYGGEEFAIILPGRSPDAAALKIQQVWQAIQEAAIPHARSQTADHVTVSFGGYIVMPESSVTTPRQLIGKADEALYRAKYQGRNQVVFA
ncbi:diguanylate cyclase domain-containing protein [[Limnothrix rosea] IAM M-220]|uniref:GGDEF domain-containing response regulator n=1 Tax=[Limnothrix rosea] IAM M-220 TaxID=454133 RepID=UPI000959BE13|nr:diguanylate cyclase [[Limnothrix rosea] IAM M-220]OKH18923.1 hypothetical protein NIES208_04210 [[Limnothrix rosea] IAM M-220]